MEISVMLYSFAGALRDKRMDAEEAIRFMASLGVKAIEPMDSLLWPAGYDAEHLRGVRALLEGLGFVVPCYDIGVDLVQDTAEKRQQAVGEVKRLLDRAVSIDAQNVLLVPGFWKEGLDPVQSREWAVTELRECAAYAASVGTRLTLEDHSPQCVSGATAQDLVDLCTAVDDLWVTYDVGNFMMGGDDPLAAVNVLGPWIRHVHFKDWAVVAPDVSSRRLAPDGKRYTGVALGEGVVPHQAALQRLNAVGYDGHISVEYEGGDDPRPQVATGVNYVRAMLDELTSA